MPLGAQQVDAFRRSLDATTGQPDHTIEVEYPEHPVSLLRNEAVPRFAPFSGLRYSRSHVRSLDDVVCPPYDVISDSERIALESRHPANIVRLELPVEGEPGLDRYEQARILLDAWRDGGILHRDPTPSFYGYRMTFKDPGGAPRRTLGVIGALALEQPGSGILPHEETTPKAKTDRLELLRATRANLSPIWGLSPGTGLTGAISVPAHALEHATDEAGTVHEVWPIDEPGEVDAIRATVESDAVLIADGHHRFETALAYREERLAAGVHTDDDDLVMALMVELTPEQLTVQAIHRLVTGIPRSFDILSGLAPWFDLTPTGPVDRTIIAQDVGRGGAGLAHTWWSLAGPAAP